MASKKEKKAAVERQLASNRGVMGLARKAHFESGGTLEAWRGRASVRTDRRKRASKRACRNFRWAG